MFFHCGTSLTPYAMALLVARGGTEVVPMLVLLRSPGSKSLVFQVIKALATVTPTGIMHCLLTSIYQCGRQCTASGATKTPMRAVLSSPYALPCVPTCAKNCSECLNENSSDRKHVQFRSHPPPLHPKPAGGQEPSNLRQISQQKEGSLQRDRQQHLESL